MKINPEIGYEPEVPRLVPRPLWSSGCQEPALCLDGPWEVRDLKGGKCLTVQVPEDMTVVRRLQGLSGHYQYEKTVELPEVPADSRFVLRFEGVNGFAEVSVDGKPAASHRNGFLTWNADITAFAAGRSKITLNVTVDEDSDQISAYSHGGILHSVYLYILPPVYVDALYLSPLFGEDMEMCTLRTDIGLAGQTDREGESPYGVEYGGRELRLHLYAPDGREVSSLTGPAETSDIADTLTFHIPVPSPVLWDAEHPELYTLEAELYRDGVKLETVRARTGLRKLERKGNRLFVNRREIKLRGVCRHEINPMGGRALTRELIRQDVALFKEANCNYIRTSHYPPSEYFLEQCDEQGIYVEDELALAFIARTLPYSQRDPEQTQRYLSHFTEAFARDYNHPAVIIWSLCNESFGGYNFDILNRYVHRKDPTRMTKFSYPMTIREEHEMPDIWSIHYSEYNADLAKKRDNVSVGHAPGYDMPVLHDEYVHVCCYNREEHRRDPNVRSFWGESVRKFWDNIWNTEGALGGAIWAGIDETDIYSGGNAQLEWGIIDVWRRKKPEHYMTRKAYSPVRILYAGMEDGILRLVLENRFCHTDLSEVTVCWSLGGEQGEHVLPPAKPRMTITAELDFRSVIKKEAFCGKEPLLLRFLDAGGRQVEEYALNIREEAGAWEDESCQNGRGDFPGQAQTGSERVLRVSGGPEGTVICGGHFRAEFSGVTGLLKELAVRGQTLLIGGPYLNAPYLRLGEWYLTGFETEEEPDKVTVTIRGGYRNTMTIQWEITITPDGKLDTLYTIERLEKRLPKQIKLRVGVDCGGLDELGIQYLAAPSMDTLTWRRRGEYTVYPGDHISRNQGTARRYSKGSVWGVKPEIPWSLEMKNDILNGAFDVAYKGTNDFRSTKENICEAWLCGTGQAEGGRLDAAGMDRFVRPSGPAVGILSRGEVSVRLEVRDLEEWKIRDTDPRIAYHGIWYSCEDMKESDHGTEMWSREKGAYAECVFRGTGIVWYGPQDTTYGMANVYIDGVLMGDHVNQRVAGVDFSCSSVGYDKKYHIPVFSADGLSCGEHTIRIEVCGEKAADASDCYVVIDYLRVLDGGGTEPVALLINEKTAYPHISWGNYRREPILIQDGSRGGACLRFR